MTTVADCHVDQLYFADLLNLYFLEFSADWLSASGEAELQLYAES
jgi:hypothetical protein